MFVKDLGAVVVALDELDVAGGCHWQRITFCRPGGEPESADFRLESPAETERVIAAVAAVVRPRLARVVRAVLQRALADRRAA
jgi:hypothetical protein